MVTLTELEVAVQDYGEVFVVLESGYEYTIHGNQGYDVTNGLVEVNGMKGDEYIIAKFPTSAIEHLYTHKEV